MRRNRVRLTRETRDALKVIVDCADFREAALMLSIHGFPVILKKERAFLRFPHKNFVLCARLAGVHFPTKTGDCVARYGEIRDILLGRSLGFQRHYDYFSSR